MRSTYLFAAPSKLLHEGTHIAAALPLADHLRLDLVPDDGETLLRVEFSEGVPPVLAALPYLAPTAVGLLFGMAAVSTGATPDPTALETPFDQLLAGLLVIYWGHYTLPSGADVGGAAAALAGEHPTTRVADQEVSVRGAD